PADMLVGQGRLGAAERYLQGLYALEPRPADVDSRLALLLELEGRRWEARSHLLEMLCTGRDSLEILVFFGNRMIQFELSEQLERARNVAPEDAAVWTGLARQALTRGDMEGAEQFLRTALSADPLAIESHALLGNLLAGRPREFLDWQRALPAAA